MSGGMSDSGFPVTGAARVHVLQAGYVRESGGVQHVASTVTLILDGDAVIVVEPGMVPDRDLLLAALAGHGPAPADVTDVVFSHHHPDHTVNAALFPAARIHDHWACYDGDVWTTRDAEGTVLSPSVRLLRTPGHSAEDITTLAAGPADDPFAADREVLRASRERLLGLASVIIPGHGPAFRPGERTPR